MDAKQLLRRQRRLSAVYQVVLLACIAYPVLNRDPFGALSISERYSQDLLNIAMGNWHFVYPHKQWQIAVDSGTVTQSSVASAAADDAAVVVLVNESALRIRGERWPASLRFHAQALEELATFRPRAIFVDFLVLQEQPDTDKAILAGTLNELRERGIRTYVAVSAVEDLQFLSPRLPDDGQGLDRYASTPIGVTPVSVQKLTDGSDYVSRRYPGWSETHGPTADGRASLPAAALAVFCDEAPAAVACREVAAQQRAGRDYSFDLIWGVTPHPANAGWNAGTCQEMNRTREAVMGSGVGAGQTPGCVHIATIFADSLLGSATTSGGRSTESLQNLIAGRTIFYGGNFRASGDLVHTGVHTTLPGIYYHAMAYDNLVAFDGRPKVRREYRSDGLLLAGYDLLVLMALSSLFVLRQRMLERLDRRPPTDEVVQVAALDRWAARLARVPTYLLVFGTCAFLVIIGLNPEWRAITLVLAAVVALGVGIVGRPHQPPGTMVARSLVTVALLIASAVVIGCAVLIGYRRLALPPLDWIKYFAFATLGFFLANLVVVDFIDRLVRERSNRKSRK